MTILSNCRNLISNFTEGISLPELANRQNTKQKITSLSENRVIFSIEELQVKSTNRTYPIALISFNEYGNDSFLVANPINKVARGVYSKFGYKIAFDLSGELLKANNTKVITFINEKIIVFPCNFKDKTNIIKSLQPLLGHELIHVAQATLELNQNRLIRFPVLTFENQNTYLGKDKSIELHELEGLLFNIKIYLKDMSKLISSNSKDSRKKRAQLSKKLFQSIQSFLDNYEYAEEFLAKSLKAIVTEKINPTVLQATNFYVIRWNIKDSDSGQVDASLVLPNSSPFSTWSLYDLLSRTYNNILELNEFKELLKSLSVKSDHKSTFEKFVSKIAKIQSIEPEFSDKQILDLSCMLRKTWAARN